jgi:hypothetical protein
MVRRSRQMSWNCQARQRRQGETEWRREGQNRVEQTVQTGKKKTAKIWGKLTGERETVVVKGRETERTARSSRQTSWSCQARPQRQRETDWRRQRATGQAVQTEKN